jgi:hypothetical protein
MLQPILRAPRTAEDISEGVRLARMTGRTIGPADVAKLLRDAGVKYVIVGAHASNGYTARPRNTIDVDVIVQYPKKAAQAIAAAYPDLEMRDTQVVTRFMEGEKEAIDLMKATASKLWGRLLKESREIRIEQGIVRIPVLEGVLAAKFASMVSPLRRLLDRQQDSIDFARIIEANPKIDLDQVQELGELVFSGGGAFLAKLVDDARAGRRLEI